MACGISMKEENYLQFKLLMEKAAADCLKDTILDKKIAHDLEIGFHDITDDFLKEIELLEPFGEGNPEPIFFTKNVFIVEKKYLKEEKHLKLKLQNNDKKFDSIYFNINDDAKSLVADMKREKCFKILYSVRKNTYKQKQYNQLVLYDLF